MKKLFSLFLIGFTVFAFAQELNKDSLAIAYYFDHTFDLKKKINRSSVYCYFSENEDIYVEGKKIFLITDIGVCDKKHFIKGYFFGKEFYIEDKKENFTFFIPKISQEKFNFDDIENSFRKLNYEERNNLSNYSKRLSVLFLEEEISKTYNYIQSFDKYSIAIIDARPTSNYSMTGAKFKIYNSSKKTIKYITFNFYGKNPVKDKVQYRSGVYNVSRKGIGPIESYATGTWEFDDVWLTDIVEYLTLTSMNIIYMDGTSRVIKVTDNLWIDEDKMNTFLKLSDFRDSLE